MATASRNLSLRYLALLCVAIATGFIALPNAVRADDGAAIGKPAPQFSLVDQDGKTVSLKDFAGKIVVLEWTNPKCPIVQRHYAAHTMLNLFGEYKDKNVAWVAINSSFYASQDEDKQWATEQNIPYSVLNDSSGATGHAYGATNTPNMFIIGTDGTLLYRGAIDNDPYGDKAANRVNYVDKALTEILGGKPVSQPETQPYGCSVKYAN
jgi:peroxiredoxin